MIRKRIFGVLLSTAFAIGSLVSPIRVQAEGEEENVKDNNKTYYSEAYYAGHDDDFSKERPIEVGDYNYGWSIGKFCVSGFSARMTNQEGNYVFLKNVGDKINLSFILEQSDLDDLNGKGNLYIKDIDSRDEYFQTQNIEFGKGTLILRYTDFEGTKHEPVIYTNYLKSLKVDVENEISMEGPDTKVYLLEEGDYEVALDYRVAKEKKGPLFINPTDKYQDYRIFFKFSIRNGNCMAFIRDAVTGNELTNESVTQNGFVVDMANSKYLQMNIKKEVMSDGHDGLVEDTRYNRPVSDGEKFTEEGMYTLTTKNIYTGESTVKKIYVGQDEVMIAFVNSNYSIEKINGILAQGGRINENGEIEWPELPETTENTQVITDENNTTEVENIEGEDALSENTEVESQSKRFVDKITDWANDNLWITIGAGAFVIILIMLMVMIKRKHRKQKKQKENSNE